MAQWMSQAPFHDKQSPCTGDSIDQLPNNGYPSVYNAIIGRPTLNVLQAIASTYHLALKFLMPTGIGVILGNQVEVRSCYALALKGPPKIEQKTNAIESTEQPS